VLHRLRTDLQLTLITVFGACALVGVPPFAIYRFLSGDRVAGFFDLALVAVIAAVVVYAWRSADTRRPALVLVFINTIGATASGLLLGPSGLFWMYAVLASNFFLTDRLKATLLSATALAILVVHGKSFESGVHMASFLVTAVIVSVMSLIVAYRFAWQRQQLEELAIQDPLTGVHNRRAMEHELEIAVEAHKRTGGNFGLVMVDLDHFKMVNDQYGHSAGDRVLIAFANLIRRSTRAVDRMFRFGGEEFVLLLPVPHVGGLRLAAENLRLKIAAELRHPGGRVTGSLGCAMLMAGESWQSWLARADAALYRAKQGGRDRVVIDGHTDVADAPILTMSKPTVS
jgi:diguanylate cyclase (GGDEF)-like protein